MILQIEKQAINLDGAGHCPDCGSEGIGPSGAELACGNCGAGFQVESALLRVGDLDARPSTGWVSD